MEQREYWRWVVWSDTHHRRVTTRHRMTEADALSRDPAAERVPDSMELRRVQPVQDAAGLATKTPGL